MKKPRILSLFLSYTLGFVVAFAPLMANAQTMTQGTFQTTSQTSFQSSSQNTSQMSIIDRIQMDLNKFFGNTSWSSPGFIRGNSGNLNNSTNFGTGVNSGNTSTSGVSQTMPASCFTFNNTLRLGSSGYEVVSLHNMLSKEGFNLPNGNSNQVYSEITASLVTGFQEKYRSEILTRAGLSYGTGIVGANTRAKLNALYGCNRPNPQPNPVGQAPVISGVNAPTYLNINQSGTWTVSARDPENGQLNYSVIWGDESQNTTSGFQTSAPMSSVFTQQATFSHTYSRSGVFNPTFIVRDNTGLEARTSTSVTVGSGNTSTSTQGELTYTLSTDKSTYTSNESIRMTLTVYNSSYSDRILDFSTGCQTSYSIGSYDSGLNQPCTLALTSVRVPARSSYSWTIDHSPNSYQIPNGTYTLTARVIGFGQATTQINISGTQSNQNVRLVSPNGGEYWRFGSVQSISWALPNVQYIRAPLATVNLVPYYAPCTGFVCPMYAYQAPYTILRNYSGTQFSWNVGAILDSYGRYVNGGQYKIQVCLDNSSSVCDESDGYFTIGQ